MDPDDIIRQVDEADQAAVNREIQRLNKKRSNFKGSFTRSVNSLKVLITNAKGENETFDRTATEPINRERDKLEIRYERLQRLHDRMYDLVTNQGDLATINDQRTESETLYNQSIKSIGTLVSNC